MLMQDELIGVVCIPLTQEKLAYVDDVDKDLSEIKWSYHDTGYARSTINYYGENGEHTTKMLLMHRVILSRCFGRILLRTEYTDHIDCDKLNNRRSNLRIATHSQNLHNQVKTNKSKTSKYKGVHWRKVSCCWRAQISFGGKSIDLGLFDNEIDAAKAYNVAALIYGMEFSNLNIVDYEKEN